MIGIKGIKQGVLVTLPDTTEWEVVIEALSDEVDRRGAFFKGAQWVLDLQNREASQEDILYLRDILQAREVQLLGLLSTHETTRAAARALLLHTHLDEIPTGIRTASPEPEEGQYVVPPVDSEEYGTGGVLIKRTLRSGRTVRSQGHVVVIGDVNSGAEIIANGDIVIWGKVRGVVHAGAQGDESAVVCALDLAPTQLRIAGLITIPPQETNKRRTPQPEIARVINGQIEAVPWD